MLIRDGTLSRVLIQVSRLPTATGGDRSKKRNGDQTGRLRLGDLVRTEDVVDAQTGRAKTPRHTDVCQSEVERIEADLESAGDAERPQRRVPARAVPGRVVVN